MTEDEARAWLEERYESGALERLSSFHDLLQSESGRQNLVSKSTLSLIWSRHFVDSAQLLSLAPAGWRDWIDIGSGAGLPGLVLAILGGRPTTLIEPRRLRVEFLSACAAALDLKNVQVVHAKAEQVQRPPASVISARAVAKLEGIFAMSTGFADFSTTYVLPKGQSAYNEVSAIDAWRGRFHVEQSVIDPTSGIVVATQVRR